MDTFDAVYRQFQPKLARYLTHLLGEVEAEDVLQGVMLRVSQALPDFRGDSSLQTWLYRIATNAARDQLRTRRSKAAQTALADDEQPTGPELTQSYIRHEMSACVRELIDQLPQSYRWVLLLSDYEDLSNPEIAAILGLTVDTVKIRLHRARARLRQKMECACHFYQDREIGLMCDRRQK